MCPFSAAAGKGWDKEKYFLERRKSFCHSTTFNCFFFFYQRKLASEKVQGFFCLELEEEFKLSLKNLNLVLCLSFWKIRQFSFKWKKTGVGEEKKTPLSFFFLPFLTSICELSLLVMGVETDVLCIRPCLV